MAHLTSIERRPCVQLRPRPWVTAIGLIVGALAFGGTAKAQSAFTRKQFSVYAKLGASLFNSSRFYDLSGSLNKGETLSLNSAVFYGEFGILDQLTVFVNWQAFRANSYEKSTTALGVGDLRIGLKYGHTFFKRHHVAVIVAPEFPTGDSEATVQENSTLVTGQVVTRDVGLPTGDGEFNVWTRLAYSVSWYEINSWASAHFGANWRTKGFHHQLAFGFEIGHFLFRRVYLTASLQGQVVPFPTSKLKLDTGFIFGEGTEFIAVGAGLAVPIPWYTPIALTFDWSQIVAFEHNVYAGPQFTFGVSFQWEPKIAGKRG